MSYPLNRNRKQWAIVSQNCSIPGASAAPVAYADSKEKAEKLLESGKYDPCSYVDQIPWGAEYISEISEEWVCHPLKKQTNEIITIECIELKHTGKFASTFYIYHEGLDRDLSWDDVEWDFISDLILKGYASYGDLTKEILEIAIEEGLPEGVDKTKLNRWLRWYKSAKNQHRLFD